MAERLNAIALKAIRFREKPRGFESSSLRVLLIFMVVSLGYSWQECFSEEYSEVVFPSGELRLKGHLCKPDGAGPFPAVVYHHGGFGEVIGGAPEETCRALAKVGFVGFSPIRRKEISLDGNLQDALAAMDHVKELSFVDQNRLGILGFSRGGLLALIAATRRSDLKAVVLMAPAPGRGHLGRVLSEVGKVSTPVIIMVSENDTVQADHVGLAYQVKGALESAGKPVQFILYPTYQRDGHRMFFEVGAYWKDVESFLQEHL